MIVGRIDGVCASQCSFDADGVCTRCKALDGNEYIVVRLPTEETARREQLRADFTRVAEELGVDPSILSIQPLAKEPGR